MDDLLQRHLARIAHQVGSFLRGFDDPAVHVGTPEQFAREFGKLVTWPALRTPGEGVLLSYMDALRVGRAPVVETTMLDPAAVLIRGLGGPATLAAEPRHELEIDALREDIHRLLRTPALRFYLHLSDRERFLEALTGVAQRGGFSLAIGSADATLASSDPTREAIVLLPMVSAVLAMVSFDMLREAVALDLVESYQEEGAIRPLDAAKEAP